MWNKIKYKFFVWHTHNWVIHEEYKLYTKNEHLERICVGKHWIMRCSVCGEMKNFRSTIE